VEAVRLSILEVALVLYVGAHEYAGVDDDASLLVRKEEDRVLLSPDLMPEIYYPILV
jgi:hypothetical protein